MCFSKGLLQILLASSILSLPFFGWAEKTKQTVFDHSLYAHIQRACIDCHTEGASASQNRPGESHLTCAGSGCHQLFKPNKSPKDEAVCLNCHDTSEPWQVNKDRLSPYPPQEKNRRSHCTAFPHKSHLALSDEPINDQCVSCHQSREEGPSHEICVSCHIETGEQTSRKGNEDTHSFNACDQCHKNREKRMSNLCSKWSVKRQFRVGKRFDHSLHSMDIRENPPTPLSCGNCHPHVAKHNGYKDGKGRKWIKIIPQKAMARSCGGCHNGRIKNPQTGKRIFSVKDTNACSRCHPSLKFSARQKKRDHGRSAW